MSAAAATPEDTGSGRDAALEAWRESQRAARRTRKARKQVDGQAALAQQVYDENHFTEKLRRIIRGGTGAA